MIRLLAENPLLLLFLVAAVGYPLGQIRIRGSSLGVASVLFVGLAAGAIHPDLKLPEVVYSLGLALFVYALGLASGPAFFASFQRKGLRDNLFVVGLVFFAALLTALLQRGLRLPPALAGGLFAGSLTNTPALAGLLEYLKGRGDPAHLAEPVVGYSIAYPAGVVGVILAILILQRVWRTDYAAETEALKEYSPHERLQVRTLEVTRAEATEAPVAVLIHDQHWHVVMGRVQRAGSAWPVQADTRLALGDLVTAISTPEELDRVTAFLGKPHPQHLEFDQSVLDSRRIFVSDPRVACHRIRDLHIQQRFGAVITRVRRGDSELLPTGDTLLELGDRVRVLVRRERMAAVSAFFGDSYRALSEIDVLTFSLGLAAGLLLGLLPIPLPGGLTLRLGFAGGPLLVALVLGALAHTGPLVWSLPYSAGLTLRQVGLVLFLAGVGTRSGYAFVATLRQGQGLTVFLAGAAITAATALAALWIGHRALRIPMSLLTGMVAGLHTQPAVLGFALQQARNELPNTGYAAVFPMAMIAKILVAQVLVALLA